MPSNILQGSKGITGYVHHTVTPDEVKVRVIRQRVQNVSLLDLHLRKIPALTASLFETGIGGVEGSDARAEFRKGPFVPSGPASAVQDFLPFEPLLWQLRSMAKVINR